MLLAPLGLGARLLLLGVLLLGTLAGLAGNVVVVARRRQERTA